MNNVAGIDVSKRERAWCLSSVLLESGSKTISVVTGSELGSWQTT